MQFKRIAAVAAAAVVGPAVFMTTPAVADEQQPAVSVPDSAPKGDAAAGDEPASGAAPAAPGGGQPAPAGGKTAEAKEAAADSILMGPDVTVAGIPKGGFKADGGWTPLTVKVDNSAHIEVVNYTPRISLSQSEGKLKAGQVKVERLVADAAGNTSWKLADAIDGLTYGLGEKASVARESVYTIDVRISFTADTAAVPFKLDSAGLSIRADGGRAWSPTTWYETGIAGATADPGDTVFVDGPSLSLTGVPAGGFEAGGDWGEVGLHVDNSGKQTLDNFVLAFAVDRPDFSRLGPEHLELELYGKNGWEPVKYSYHEHETVYFELGTSPIAAGQGQDVKLRIRFAKDAPLGDIVLRPAGGGADDLGSDGQHVWVYSPAQGRLSRIVAATPAGPATGGTTGTGNQHAPNGGSVPIGNAGTAATGQGAQTGGELAATGSDPATAWALGGAGVALAMGAALVAGTGRHRRRTTA
ncbi:hypothetical protein SAVIM338S_07277 [Streptomyces avidinii]